MQLVLAQDVTWQLKPVESVMVDGQVSVSRTMHSILVGSLEDQRPELVARMVFINISLFGACLSKGQGLAQNW